MEMKNICGKIPVDLHEKMKLEIEELGISIPKYLEMVRWKNPLMKHRRKTSLLKDSGFPI